MMMNRLLLLVTLLLALTQFSGSFTLHRFYSRKCSGSNCFTALSSENTDKPKDSISDSEMSQVNKGLTHIKYNKYAPTAEEAAGMTDEQFRGTIYRRMVCWLVPRNFDYSI